MSQRELLRSLFQAAVDAADPAKLVPRHLPPKPRGRTIVVGAGKASAAMARALESWDGLQALVVTATAMGCPVADLDRRGRPSGARCQGRGGGPHAGAGEGSPETSCR
jgi:hydroxypyruvate reductase